MKNDWQQIRPNVWEYKTGLFTARVYLPTEGDWKHVWRYDVLEGEKGYVHMWQKPASPDLGVSKRIAKKWIASYIAKTNTTPQDEEQAKLLAHATRLEALEAMQKRLVIELSRAKVNEQTALADVLAYIWNGEEPTHD